jgi:hypothetical protein
MLRTLLLISFVALIGFTSCEKTITKTACFTFSKNTIKMGDTVYLFNCSEGYQSAVWYLPNGTIDSNRNSFFTPTFSGPNPVLLRVGNYAFTDTIGAVKILTVEP